MGDSRGHWEGDTLVVETTNFTDRRRDSAARNSEKLKLTERFTRIDPQMIDYRIRVEDPVDVHRAVHDPLDDHQQPDYQLYEYSCHEGNGAVGNALSGERAYEREVAKALARACRFRRARWGWKCTRAARSKAGEPVREFGVPK